MVDAQALFDLPHAVAHVEAAGLVRVRFVPDGLLDLVGDVFDVAFRLVVDGGIHSLAVGVAQHHDQPTPQMPGGVLNAAELVVVDDIARQPDDEQFPDARREDVLRDDPRIRTGDDDGVLLQPNESNARVLQLLVRVLVCTMHSLSLFIYKE